MMRYETEKRPKQGTKRIKEEFLWFKLEIDNEVRWLEKAKWEEKCFHTSTIFGDIDRGNWMWEATRWIDEGGNDG